MRQVCLLTTPVAEGSNRLVGTPQPDRAGPMREHGHLRRGRDLHITPPRFEQRPLRMVACGRLQHSFYCISVH